jgi:hypothetical protein
MAEKVSSPKAKGTRHKCIQGAKLKNIEGNLVKMDEKMQRVYVIVTGNGNPENSILFQLAGVKKGQEDVSKAVNMLIEKYEESIKLANSAVHAVEIYNGEKKGFEKGQADAKETDREVVEREKREKDERHAKLMRIFTAISVTIAAVALVINTIRNFNTVTKVDTVNSRIEDLGTPVIINKRSGEIVNLPAEFGLKYYPNDFDDSTKTDTIR